MFNRCETFRDCRTTIPLSSLKVSTLFSIHCGLYGSANTQNRMCEVNYVKSGHRCDCPSKKQPSSHFQFCDFGG